MQKLKQYEQLFHMFSSMGQLSSQLKEAILENSKIVHFEKNQMERDRNKD